MQQTGRCPNCGSPIAPGQRFCGGCGGQLPAGCPYCGAAVTPGFRFCQNCGGAVGGGTPQQPGGMQQQPGGMQQQQPGWGQQQPGWGQQQPGWGQQQPAWGEATPRSRSAMAPLLMLLLVILLGGLGALVWFYFGDELAGLFSSSSTTTPTTTVPSANTTTTELEISNVVPISTANTTATITWTTNELASSQVEYGTTADLGSFEPSTPANDPTSGTSIGITTHSVDLTGLTYGTTYYYKAKSKDAAGNVAESDVDLFPQTPSSE
ncbi:MAG: zinc ribbon domain-containing protein [Dehalococcoidia bacterium]|nr:zinc ribbon domain-containing protein [Dehalococcoidia bacterium]